MQAGPGSGGTDLVPRVVLCQFLLDYHLRLRLSWMTTIAFRRADSNPVLLGLAYDAPLHREGKSDRSVALTGFLLTEEWVWLWTTRVTSGQGRQFGLREDHQAWRNRAVSLMDRGLRRLSHRGIRGTAFQGADLRGGARIAGGDQEGPYLFSSCLRRD